MGKLVETFLYHDLSARQSKELMLLIEDMGFEGYGLFWAIVEFMHKNNLKVGEERFVAGKEYVEKIKEILTNYGLFHTENDFYVSERIKRNLEKQKSKSEQASDAAKIKWLTADFEKYFTEIFGGEPVLEKEDIEALRDYSAKIKNFRKILPDILYTLSLIKWNGKAEGYYPSVGWLLSEHNLSEIVNGKYGKLKSWKEEKERRKKQKRAEELALAAAEAEKQNEFNLNNFTGKAEAVEFLRENIKDVKHIIPPYKAIMKQFDITVKELS